MSRVLVALSGGVDSSVAAALLVADGHDVTAVHLKLADTPDDAPPGHGCCTLDDAQDARRTAAMLDIPFYVWDLRDAFDKAVQTPFARAYATGTTPNPCVTCNEKVKYAALLDRARAAGFDALATGHYAQLRRDGRPVTTPGANVTLHRAKDNQKDQSYVLYMAQPEQLAHTLLPIGGYTKTEVREIAAAHGFRVAGKPDSYDICFIPDGDTVGYLEQHLPVVTGPIVDVDGTVLGEHDGVWRYTVGQRRGLGLDHHERRFVADVNATTNTVTVGPRDALACRWIHVAKPKFTNRQPDGTRFNVQIRAHGRAHDATVAFHDDGMRVTFNEDVFGVALGQAAVLYDTDNDACYGGGIITDADRDAVFGARHG